jgi:hypothetical protein
MCAAAAADERIGGMNITGVDFITVPTQDYERSSAFCRDVLGLTFGKRWRACLPASTRRDR